VRHDVPGNPSGDGTPTSGAYASRTRLPDCSEALTLDPGLVEAEAARLPSVGVSDRKFVLQN